MILLELDHKMILVVVDSNVVLAMILVELAQKVVLVMIPVVLDQEVL